MPTSYQLFAHEFDTHDSTKMNTVLQAQGIDPDEMTQLSYVQMQVNLQKNLIRDNVTQTLSPDKLTVFLAPEFFFKWRNGLPYDRGAFFNSIDYFKAVSQALGPVLWVAGTFWWCEPVDANMVRVHNTLLVLQSGSLVRTLQKTRLSQLDGLNQGPQTWDRWDPESARILEETQDPFFTATTPGGTPVACGVDVCLDHLTLAGPPQQFGVLRTKYLEANPNPAFGAGVDVHLLVAAGMQTQPENVAARSGGCFLRCDGGQGALRSQSLSVTRAGPDPAAALRLWTPTLTPQPVAYVGADPDNRLAVYPATLLG